MSVTDWKDAVFVEGVVERVCESCEMNVIQGSCSACELLICKSCFFAIGCKCDVKSERFCCESDIVRCFQCELPFCPGCNSASSGIDYYCADCIGDEDEAFQELLDRFRTARFDARSVPGVRCPVAHCKNTVEGFCPACNSSVCKHHFTNVECGCENFVLDADETPKRCHRCDEGNFEGNMYALKDHPEIYCKECYEILVADAEANDDDEKPPAKKQKIDSTEK